MELPESDPTFPRGQLFQRYWGNSTAKPSRRAAFEQANPQGASDPHTYADAADKVATSDFPTRLVEQAGGLAFKKDDNPRRGGVYLVSNHAIGLEYNAPNSTVVHEMTHAAHMRGHRVSLPAMHAADWHQKGDPHLEGVADGGMARWGGGGLGYEADSWNRPIDQAVYATTRGNVQAHGVLPPRSLMRQANFGDPDDFVPFDDNSRNVDLTGSRKQDDVIARWAREDSGLFDKYDSLPGMLVRRNIVHQMTANSPEADSYARHVHEYTSGVNDLGPEIDLAHQQHAARQGPMIQQSMLVDTFDGDDMTPVVKGGPEHVEAVSRGAHVQNMSKSQFGELGVLSDEEAAASPEKMLPNGVIKTGRWSTTL